MSTSLRRLGKYELHQQLGRGKAGEVWKARDLSLQRDVAIKTLYTDLQQSDPHFLTRFTEEGQRMVSLHHTNIVKVHEADVSRAAQSSEITAYIAMEYIEGPTLTEFLNTTSHRGIFPSISEIIYLFTSLGVAVDYAHQQGIVHGNIKPGNILLNKQNTGQFSAGEPLLADCGLAQLVGIPGVATTPHYMSPEQAKGYPATNRSDIYALGVMLYEICTGVVPFRDESSVAVMMQHINTLPTPPILINPNIPPALSEVILRAMAKEPSTRFSLASLLGAAIADACSMQSVLYLGEQEYSSEDDVDAPNNAPQTILGVSQPAIKSSSSLPGVRPQQGLQPRIPALSPLSPLSQPLPAARVENQAGTRPLPESSSTTTKSAALQSQTPVPPLPEPPIRPVPTPASSNTQFSMPGANHSVSGPLPPAYAPVPHPLRTNQTVSAPLPGSNIPHSSMPAANHPISAPLSTERFPVAMTPSTTGEVRREFTPLPSQQTRPALPFKIQQRINDSPAYVIIAALIMLFVIIGGALLANLLLHKGQMAGALAGHVFFQDDALGHSDQLRITLQNIDTPADGQTYFAWLQDTAHRSHPLGALTMHDGTASLLYAGDSKHTNLLSIAQGVIITVENAGSTPAEPGAHKAYQAMFDPALAQSLKEMLYITPNVPDKQAAITVLFETIKSMNDKAASVVDSLQGTQDDPLAMRQATRIIEMVDGAPFATSSGDRPARLPSQLSGIQIGLLSSPTREGYIDMVDKQLDQVKQAAGNNTALLEHIQNARNALTDLRDWVQKIRGYDVQLLKATDLHSPATLGLALQIKQAAADSYTGHVIPPNDTPQPIPGSAGASQAYTEAQYMATLDLQTV